MKRNYAGSCIPNTDDQNQNASASEEHLASTSISSQPYNPHQHSPLNFHLPQNPYNTPHSNQAVSPPQQTGARNQFDAAAVRGNISHSHQFRHQASWNSPPTYSYANQQHYVAVRQAQTWTQPCSAQQYHYHQHENTQLNIPQNLPVYPSHVSTQQIYNPHSIGHQYMNQLPYSPNLIQSGVHDDVAPIHQKNNQQLFHPSSFGAMSNDNNPHLNSAQQSQPSTADHPAQQASQHFQAGMPPQLQGASSSMYPVQAMNQQVAGARNQFDSQQFQNQTLWNTQSTSYANQQHYVALFNQQLCYPSSINTNRNYTSQTNPAQQPQTYVAARSLNYPQHESQQAPQHFPTGLTPQLDDASTSTFISTQPQVMQQHVTDQTVGDKQRIDMREASVSGSSIVGVQGNVHQGDVQQANYYYNTSGRPHFDKKDKVAAIEKLQEEHIKSLPESVVLYDETLKPTQLPDVHPRMHEYKAYRGLWRPVGTEEFIPSTRQKLSSTANQQPVSFNTILHLSSKKGFIALVGPPGSGKTTLSKQLAKLTQPNQSVKFHLRFMDLNYNQPLTCKELFVDCLCPGLDNETKEKAFQWMVENQDKCVFVFDGYDQALWTLENVTPVNASYDTSLPIDQLVANLCCKKIFKDSLLIFTSRPHKILKLPSHLRPDVTVHVDDLSTEDMEKLFRAFAGKKADELWELISTKTPQLFSLCHNPLLLQFIVFAVLDQGLNKVKTVTEVFQIVLDQLRYSDHARNMNITNLWKPLGKMAYEGMLQKTVVFTQGGLGSLKATIVQDIIIAFARKIGIPNQRLFDGDQLFYFLHQMLQEMFAAKYICEFMPDEEFHNIIPEVAKGGHWSMVRRFLCGLLLGNKGRKNLQSLSCDPAPPIVQLSAKPTTMQGFFPIRNFEQFQHQLPRNNRPTSSYTNQLHYAAVNPAHNGEQLYVNQQSFDHQHGNVQMNNQPIFSNIPSHIRQFYDPHYLYQLPYPGNLAPSGMHHGVAPFHQNNHQQSYHLPYTNPAQPQTSVPPWPAQPATTWNYFYEIEQVSWHIQASKVEMFRKELIEYMTTNLDGHLLIDLLTDLQECSDDEKDFLASYLPVKFNFIGTPISSSAAHALAEILPRLNRTVEWLALDRCNLNSDTLRVICGGISKMEHGMDVLDLIGNEFGNPGVEIISASGCLRKVKKLVLLYCGISDDGKQILCRELERLGLPRKTVDFGSFQ